MKITHLKQQQKTNNMKITQTTCLRSNTNNTRVQNNTNIQFTQDEIQLLSKGLQYNLHYKNKNWIKTLALEAETAINKLDIIEQNYYRHVIAKQIKDMSKNMINHNNHNNKRGWRLIMNVKKIHNNKLTITKADKGKTLVIITEDEYKQKIIVYTR
jgi:hypothetical protein